MFYDQKGRQLCPGDLIKTPHFIGPRREQYWLYHVVVQEGERLRMVPTAYLNPTTKRSGGDPIIDQASASNCEIIDGVGPGECIDFRDRPKVKRVL